MDESSQSQNRRGRRSNVLMTASLELSGESLTVKLRNLSAEGALVQSERLPVEGAEVRFRKGDLSIAGRVAWSREGVAGIQFATPLAPGQVLRHVPAPRPRVAPKFQRPGLGARELSRQELEFAERCLITPPAETRPK